MGGTSANFQRALIDAPTSYMPSVRAGGALPLNADIDVSRWRRMGASWQAIASNLNCSVHTVRKTWDPSYVPVHEPAAPLVRAREGGSRAAGQVARNTYQYDILAVLAEGDLSRIDLGLRIKVRPQDFSRLIGVLIEKRLILEGRRNFFALTAAGRAELERHAAGEDSFARRCAGPMQARRRERAIDILRLLAKGPITAPALMARTGMGEGVVRDLLRDLRAEGEVTYSPTMKGGPFLWSVTDSGRALAKGEP